MMFHHRSIFTWLTATLAIGFQANQHTALADAIGVDNDGPEPHGVSLTFGQDSVHRFNFGSAASNLQDEELKSVDNDTPSDSDDADATFDADSGLFDIGNDDAENDVIDKDAAVLVTSHPLRGANKILETIAETNLCAQDLRFVSSTNDAQYTTPPIQITRQTGSQVQFQIQNVWSPEDGTSEVYTVYQTSGATACFLHVDLGENETAEETFTAQCGQSSTTTVSVYVRGPQHDEDHATTTIPKSCFADTTIEWPTFQHVFELSCESTCV